MRVPGSVWELTAELVVIVVLFATGLRIDDPGGRRRWWANIRLPAQPEPVFRTEVVNDPRGSLSPAAPIFRANCLRGGRSEPEREGQ